LRVHRIRARRDATIDPLTRLANRGFGMLTLEQQVARARRSALPLCVLMVDLDEFKALNDRLGHLAGDHALRVSAQVLRRNVRRADTVCRFGGEEFLIVLPDTGPQEASLLAARLFVAIEEQSAAEGLPVTASIGLACLRHGEDDVESLIERADRALYASKVAGRNRFSADTE
jgi:diguanylate cyclase (GGDEF)-like protein